MQPHPWRITLLLALLFLPVAHAQVSAADKLDRTVQAAFQKCGVRLSLSGPLSQAALDQLKGYSTQDALARKRYRAKTANGVRVTYNGDQQWLGRSLLERCGSFQDYTEYGLATDGSKAAIFFARPAWVDLSRRWQEEFLAATNKARFQGQKCGGVLMNAVPPLNWDTRLEAAAARHVRDMITLDFRGHVNPTNNSRAQQRAEQSGFAGTAGENIAYGPLTAQEAVRQLLTSPEHCKNMMEPYWTHFGGAVGNGTDKTIFPTYWVQVFGRPR